MSPTAAGDWLQGPYIYALYQHYGYGRGDIAILFAAGYASSLLLGTIAGAMADRRCVALTKTSNLTPTPLQPCSRKLLCSQSAAGPPMQLSLAQTQALRVPAGGDSKCCPRCRGRKKGVLAYAMFYGAACLVKHSSSFPALLAGRVLCGIATSLLVTAFEAWLVAEHIKVTWDGLVTE